MGRTARSVPIALLLGTLGGCSSSLGNGGRGLAPGSGEPCVEASECGPGELCIRERCVSGSADTDGDGIAARSDCDDRDERIGAVAELSCSGACGAGTARCDNGVIGPCRCMGDAGGPVDAGPADAGGEQDAGSPGDVGGDPGGGGGGEDPPPADDTCTPDPSETCDDGMDNDCDDLADCADSDCTGSVCGGDGFTCEADGSCCGEHDVSLSGSVSCPSFPCGLNQVSADGGNMIQFGTTGGGSGELTLNGFTASGEATADCSGSACSFRSVRGEGNRLIFAPSTGNGTLSFTGVTITGSFSPSCGLNVPCIIGGDVSGNELTLYASDGSSGSFTFQADTECL